MGRGADSVWVVGQLLRPPFCQPRADAALFRRNRAGFSGRTDADRDVLSLALDQGQARPGRAGCAAVGGFVMGQSVRRILVCLDGSPEGLHLGRDAAGLARRLDAELVALWGLRRPSPSPAET